jgi:hypothetical protein
MDVKMLPRRRLRRRNFGVSLQRLHWKDGHDTNADSQVSHLQLVQLVLKLVSAPLELSDLELHLLELCFDRAAAFGVVLVVAHCRLGRRLAERGSPTDAERTRLMVIGRGLFHPPWRLRRMVVKASNVDRFS